MHTEGPLCAGCYAWGWGHSKEQVMALALGVSQPCEWQTQAVCSRPWGSGMGYRSDRTLSVVVLLHVGMPQTSAKENSEMS